MTPTRTRPSSKPAHVNCTSISNCLSSQSGSFSRSGSIIPTRRSSKFINLHIFLTIVSLGSFTRSRSRSVIPSSKLSTLIISNIVVMCN